MSEILPNDTERDARLTALYQASADDPPPALDAAILAAAHRAVAARPRLAGVPFGRSWRVPLSIAAVVVLSVSLVTLMREESPEILQSPGVDLTRESDRSARRGIEPAATVSGGLAGSQKSAGLGLKPSQSSTYSGPGLRGGPESGASGKLRMDAASAERVGAVPGKLPANSPNAPAAFPGASDTRENKVAMPAEQARQIAREEAQRDIAAGAERLRAPVTARAPPASNVLSKAEVGSGVRESELARAPEAPAVAAARPAPAASGAAEDRVQPQNAARGFPAQPAPARMQAESAAPAARAVSPSTMVRPEPSVSIATREKSAASAAGSVAVPANLPPGQWLARIEELRKQGRLQEAQASLQEFRKRYPDFTLPASLRDGIQP